MLTYRFLALISLVAVWLTSPMASIMAQNSADDLFKRANEATEEKHYDTACILYKEIVRDHSDSPLLPRALNNLGILTELQEDHEGAIAIFQQIIDGAFNDMEEWGAGSGIMIEPYAMYKHQASIRIARIHVRANRFTDALPYVALADTVYEYEHFCLNEYAGEAAMISWLYADCYEGIGDIDRAITVLVPTLRLSRLISINQIFHRLDSLVHLHYTDDEILQLLEEAGKNIRIVRQEELVWNSDSTKILRAFTYTEGHINIFGADVPIDDVPIDGENPRSTYRESPNRLSDEEWQAHFRDYMRSGYLYKLVHKK